MMKVAKIIKLNPSKISMGSVENNTKYTYLSNNIVCSLNEHVIGITILHPTHYIFNSLRVLRIDLNVK